jgi:2-isopropylmalate synthase
MSRILVFDTTLRDGEQSPGATMTGSEKLLMARQLDRLGVDILEAGFPISSPDEFEAVRQIARDIRRPSIAALARAKREDIESAAAALDGAERPRIHVFLATSQVHLGHKLEITEDQCLERIGRSVSLARSLVADVEFSPEDATRSDLAFLCRAVRAAVEAGASTINIPDTVGYAYPTEFRRIMETIVASVADAPGVVVSAHCHNDLGLAVANSLAAIEAGACQIECTVNGIGERAGNASLEEVVMALCVRNDLLSYETGIKTEEILRTSELLSSVTGILPQPNKAIVGRNAFAHEAGIHQAGMLKNTATYEIMRPESVGVPESRLVLGKHSGRHAIAKRCRDLGYEVDESTVLRVYQHVVMAAGRKKQILDEDLLTALEENGSAATDERIELSDLRVTCGGERSGASVRLRDAHGQAYEAEAEGDGPVAAAFAAIASVLHVQLDLQDMSLIPASVGNGQSSAITLNARVEGRTLSGRGVATDLVRAAALAYLDVVNRAVRLGVVGQNAMRAPDWCGV